ncbi:transcription factor TFIIIB component B'' homolog [Sander lucioperca]|uniref:transcription factor TFIIIB component B'' homolog n=1 Tax=Sander lucioperca TaxID=283035 RepID=UPI001653BC06|nr:transcription factor TFIIIB component B'' homolog [Sander lucioperca]
MFRRSRFSIRPNVVTAGRTAAAPQEAPSANQEANETPKDVSESSTTTAVTDNKSVVTPSEKPAAPGDGNDQNGEGTSSSAAVQRRKRFSIKPKVAPGRPSTLARTPKSPVKAVSETPIEIPVSDLDKPTKSTQSGTIASPQRLQSPRRRRASEESKQPKTQPKPIIIPSDSSEPSAVPTAKDFLEQIPLPTDSGKELESTSGSPVEEVPSRLPDKVPPSLPDKEAIEISEKAKNLVSSKTGLSLSQPAFSLSRLLNDPSDLQRIAKAQKLRELLKQEMHKEKKIKRAKARVKEYTLDPAKMTMRDLIRYLPLSNPMTSSLEDATRENETVVPPSPVREDSPERAQEPVVLPKIASPREEAEEEADADADEEQDGAVMVPQVKVAEDGSLIIDEESLTVEVQRAKGPNPAQDRDPIFERGSTTTYSSFRKGTYSKPWSSEETDMFLLAISMVGTDFSMICQLFPHRARSEIKNKFKKEERENAWRIDKAFRERRKLDIEYFSKLLEKILEVQKTRKKLKSLTEKKSPKKKENKKTEGKKASRKLSVVEEGDEEEQNEIPDLEEEGEKENEDLCNEGGTTVAKPQKKRKRKNKQDASTKEPNDKKNKTGENEQDEAYIPGDTEAALPEDCPKSDVSEKTDNLNESKDNTIKPAKLSRGRAPKPLLPLGRKWGKKPPPPSTKTNDTASDKEDESELDGASKEQVNKDPSPLKQATKRKSANDDISSGEEDVTVQPPRPTRYGRVPKPTKPLNYPGKEATHSSETTPASPAGSTASAARPKPKCTAKRGRSPKLQSAQESKKPKLVTLRASQSEYSDEEDDKQRVEEEVEEEHLACSSSNDSTAAAFVPASLRSPHPVISEVEETMEELDILANMPDVLGISQDVLCPDAFSERAQHEIGTAEPCEHQLDLLVDVIDFLSVENTEVSEDESYNEAAQTLLTIGNLAHLSQSAQNQIATQDDITGTTPVSVNETSQHLEEEIACCSKPAAQEEHNATLMSATSVHGGPETVTTVELQNRTTDTDAIPVIKSSNQRTGSDTDPTPQLHLSQESSKTNSPQTRRGRLAKVKPKPNLGQSSRTAQSKSQTETSTERTPEESHTVAPDLFQATETLSAAAEIPKIADCSKKNVNVEISHIEVKHTEKPFGSQKRSVGHVKSGAAKSDQSASENHSHYFSESQFEPSLEQTTRESRSTSASTDEVLISHVGTTESSCNNPLTSDSTVTESQIGQWSNIDSAPVKESSDHSAPVEELPVSQKEESEVPSTSQTRKSRFQKVKPKLNLAQTSRAVRSKPQTTKDTVKKDSNPTPNLKFTEKTVAQVEAEPTYITSSENPSLSPCPVIPSLDLGTTFTPTEELSTTEEKMTDVGVVCQVESDTATSDQSASENKNLSEAQFEPRREQATRDTMQTSESTDEVLMSHVGTTESSCNNPLTSDSAVTESQIGQESNRDSAPVQESIDYPASYVKPVEELPVSQKEDREVASTSQTKKSRFQRVKPNLNLAQTSRAVRSKLQTTKGIAEKDSNPTPKTIAKYEAEPTCITSPEKPCTASDLIPLLDLRTLPLTFDSAVTESQVGQGSNIVSAPVQESSDHPAPCVKPVEELPVSQKEKSKVVSTCQTTRGPLQKVKPILPQTSRTVQSKAQTTTDPFTPLQLPEIRSSPTLTSESTDNTNTEVEAQPTCSTTCPEKPSQLKSTGSLLVSVPSLELCSTHKSTEELCSTEEQKIDIGCRLDSKSEGSEQNVSQRRQRFPKVKHKPNLGSSPRTTFTKLLLKDVSKPSEQCHMDTSLTFEQQPEDNNNARTELELAETDSKTSTHCSLHTEPLSSTMLEGPAESEKSLDSTNYKGTSSDNVVIATSWVAENQSVLTDSVLTQSSEKATVEGESAEDKTSNNDVVAGPASQWDCKQGMSIRATNTQPTDDPTAVSDVHTSEDGSTESKIEFKPPTNKQSTSDPKISTQQPRSENDSEAQSQDAVQHCSETTETNQTAARRTDDNQSTPTDSPSRKAPQTCRGRLIKPKPNLGRSSQPPQPQQIQKTKQAEADFGTCSEGVDASVCQKLVSERRPDIQEPVEGAIEQCSNQNPSLSDAGSSLGCLTQVIEQLSQHDPPPNVAGSSLGCVTLLENVTQDASTSSTRGTKGHPNVNTIIPDMLLQQEPLDADEPFFILSLTEIPVCSLGEVVDSVPEPLPYLPVTDASIEQQSVSGESLAAAGDRLLSNVAVPVFMEESGDTGLINAIDIGPDPAANIDSIMENPVDPHVHASELPETVENNDETEIPPAKQRLMDTHRREAAKLQVKPNTTKRKQASKTLAAKEEESIPIEKKKTQHSELPGPSVQPTVFDDDVTEPQKGSDDHVDVEKETLTGGEDPEDSSSGAQTTRTRQASNWNRKTKGSLSLPSEMNIAAPASDSPPGKEAPKGRKVKTPRAAGKPSTPAPGASTSYDGPPTASLTQPTQETRSTSSTTSPTQTEVDPEQTSEHSPLCSDTTPSTSLCPAEVSASQQSVESSSIEEEPTTVSQYFLSDIFTEVTAEKNDETEIPPAEQTLMDTHRREAAKLQVKPNTTKRKQASKTLAAKEEESIPIEKKTPQHSELPGPSVQPTVFDDDVTEPQKGSDDHVDVEKETLTGGEDPEDSSSGAQTTRTRQASSRNRKAKGSLSLPSETNNAAPASDSPPGREAPKGRKVKTPRAAGKPSTPAPGASTSYDGPPTASLTQPTQETRSTSSTTSPTQTEVDPEQTSEYNPLCSNTTPSTSLCPAEVSASQQSVESSSIEEEPTTVSQYFLSDIFTEVTAEKNDETEIPPAEQTLMDTHRREAAKLQVKPNTTKRKPASKTLAAKEEESIPIEKKKTQHSELPGPSVQPTVFDDDVTEPQKGSDDHVDVEKETLTGGEDPEDSSSGAQTTRTRQASSRNRKAKGSLSLPSETNNAAPASDSPPGKEAPKGRKVKTPRAAGKPSTPAPGASTSYDGPPTASLTQPTQETRSTSSTTSPTQTEVDPEQTSEYNPLCSDTTPSTSLCPAVVRQVSASQQSVESSSIEEEPTTVSQYFLSDIFTEVTAEKNDETEIPPAEQTLMDTHRREAAKLQVKPNTTKRKQASKTLAAKEEESIPIEKKKTQHSELPGPSVQPTVFDDDVTEPQKGSDDHVDVEKETLTGGEDPEDSSSGAQTTRTRQASSRNRKAKGSLSLPSEMNIAAPASDSPPGKEAPKGRKVKTPRAAGKPSTPAPGASTSYDGPPTASLTQPTQETRSTSSTTSPTQTEVDPEQTSEYNPLCSNTTPSTSLCPAEVRQVSASQQSVESSSIEEEPTSVSQYFLSDIFTEVEEG